MPASRLGRAAVGGIATLIVLVAAVVAHDLPPVPLADEATALIGALQLPGDPVVGEIGAGKGEMAVELARRLGPRARYYATELNAERRTAIGEAAKLAGLHTLTVVAAGERETRLPDNCCDGLLLRHVYHHVDSPSAFAKSLARAVKPGGRVVIIDFEPGAYWHLAIMGLAHGDAHGVRVRDLIGYMTDAGFTHVETMKKWNGVTYAAVFRR